MAARQFHDRVGEWPDRIDKLDASLIGDPLSARPFFYQRFAEAQGAPFEVHSLGNGDVLFVGLSRSKYKKPAD